MPSDVTEEGLRVPPPEEAAVPFPILPSPPLPPAPPTSPPTSVGSAPMSPPPLPGGAPYVPPATAQPASAGPVDTPPLPAPPTPSVPESPPPQADRPVVPDEAASQPADFPGAPAAPATPLFLPQSAPLPYGPAPTQPPSAVAPVGPPSLGEALYGEPGEWACGIAYDQHAHFPDIEGWVSPNPNQDRPVYQSYLIITSDPEGNPYFVTTGRNFS